MQMAISYMLGGEGGGGYIGMKIAGTIEKIMGRVLKAKSFEESTRAFRQTTPHFQKSQNF